MELNSSSKSPAPVEAAKSSSIIRGADGTCHVEAAPPADKDFLDAVYKPHPLGGFTIPTKDTKLDDYNIRDSGIPQPGLKLGITPETERKLWKRLPWWKRLWALLSFGD